MAACAAPVCRRAGRRQTAPPDHEPDDEHDPDQPTQHAIAAERTEGRRDDQPDEPRDVTRACVFARVTTMADGGEPHHVDRGEWHRVQQGRAPAANHQHGHAHGDHHRDTHTGAHQRGEAGREPEVVAAAPSAYAGDQHQVDQSEQHGSDQRDLEREDDVLVTAPEEDEHSGDERRGPRSHAASPHDRAEHECEREVQDDDEELVGAVAVEAEHEPQRPVHDHGQCHPVLIVRREQIVHVEHGAVREEVPLVEEEPHRPRDVHVEDERDELREEEHR